MGRYEKGPNETGYAIVAGRTHESLRKVRTFDPPPLDVQGVFPREQAGAKSPD